VKGWYRFWRGRHRHHHHAPNPIFLGITAIVFKGATVSIVTLTGTVPITRKSGAPLARPDIDHIALTRNGVTIDQLVPTAPTFQFVDSSPLTGNDSYNAEVFTKDGFVSDPSNDAVITIVAADPAAAIGDLAAVVS